MPEILNHELEVLLRQIHPLFIQNGEPASDRFKPQPNDAGHMSVDRSSIINAALSHALYTRSGRSSGAVFGVTVGEFNEEQIECRADPIIEAVDTLANPAHALADYTKHKEKEWKLISKRLSRKAKSRGQLFP